MKQIHTTRFVLPVLLLLGSPALPALAGGSVPFKATAGTITVGSDPASCGLVFTNAGAGQGMHLGSFTLVDSNCAHPPDNLTYDGTVILTAAYGDQLFLSTHGAYDKATKTQMDAFTVTGGTGRFQGATGQGTIARQFSTHSFLVDGALQLAGPANPPVHAAMFISAINGAPYIGGKATVNVGDHVQLSLLAKFQSGGVFDYSEDTAAQYSTDPAQATFSGTAGRIWTPGEADAGKTITLNGSYTDPVSGQTIKGTATVTVRPLAPKP